MIEVPVLRPRSPDQFIDAEFLATKKRLEELIHPPVEEDETESVHMVRMTRVGDDVENGLEEIE
jgi:NitT/TauT family transport system ATP-binding protein